MRNDGGFTRQAVTFTLGVIRYNLTLESIRKKRTIQKNRRRNPQSAALTASCRGGTTFVACATFPPTEESPLLKEPFGANPNVCIHWEKADVKEKTAQESSVSCADNLLQRRHHLCRLRDISSNGGISFTKVAFFFCKTSRQNKIVLRNLTHKTHILHGKIL